MFRTIAVIAVLMSLASALAQNPAGGRKAGAAAPASPQSAAEQLSPVDALERVIPELEFEETPLESVLSRLSTLGCVSIRAEWKPLEDAQIARDTPISFRTSPLPLRTVLAIVLRQATLDAQLAYATQAGAIVVAPTAYFDRDLITRTYYVDDLVGHFRYQIPDLKFWVEPVYGRQLTRRGGETGKDLRLPNGNAAFSDWPSEQREQRLKRLAQCITETIEPYHWEVNGGPGHIAWYEGTLVVFASPRVHQMIGGPLREGDER